VKKLLAFILFIVVVVAAFTPCCTIDDCQDEITTTTEQDHSESDDGSGCSPFFACTGCPGFAVVEKPITVPVPTANHPQYFDAEFHFISSTYAFSPWQPPRIV